MWQKLKRSLKEFGASRPGHRFRESYDRHHVKARSGGWRLLLVLLIAGTLVAVGLVGLVVPGPGTLFIAAGAALIARESRPFSTLLDKLELKLQPLVRWLKGRWRAVRGRKSRRAA